MASSAPQSVRVLGWNIENYGDRKVDKAGDELVKFIAAVIREKKIDIAAFCELRLGWSETIGKAIAAELGNDWKYFGSEAFVSPRWEEYMLVWDSSKVKNVAIDNVYVKSGKKDFLTEFYGKDEDQIGFGRKTKDRPPIVGEFKTVKGKGSLRVGMTHSPGPGYRPLVQNAAIAMAEVEELRPDATPAVLMGDFNVKAPANAKEEGSWGELAFSSLVEQGFEQLFRKDELTSLTARKAVPTSAQKCKSQPYDQIFVWTGKDGKKGKHSQAQVEDLIAEGLTSTAIGKPLLALLNKVKSVQTLNKVADAFHAYRILVSDHFPVSVTIDC